MWLRRPSKAPDAAQAVSAAGASSTARSSVSPCSWAAETMASFIVTRAKGVAKEIGRSLYTAGASPSTRPAAEAISSSVMAMTSSQSKQAV